MPTRSFRVSGFVVAMALAGCTQVPTEMNVCPANIGFSLSVQVRDSLSSAPLATGSVAWFEIGSIRDSLRTNIWIDVDGELVPVGFTGGHSAGSYTVEIRKPGYRTWTARTNVEQGPCGPITESLVARLTKDLGAP